MKMRLRLETKSKNDIVDVKLPLAFPTIGYIKSSIRHAVEMQSIYELCPPFRPASLAASLPFSKLPLLAWPP